MHGCFIGIVTALLEYYFDLDTKIRLFIPPVSTDSVQFKDAECIYINKQSSFTGANPEAVDGVASHPPCLSNSS